MEINFEDISPTSSAREFLANRAIPNLIKITLNSPRHCGKINWQDREQVADFMRDFEAQADLPSQIAESLFRRQEVTMRRTLYKMITQAKVTDVSESKAA